MTELNVESISRLWQKDASLWQGPHVSSSSVKDWLGWIDAVQWMDSHIPDLMEWSQDYTADRKLSTVVLLGMGGSSLAAEVFYTRFGQQDGCPEILVLDTTSPAEVKALDLNLDTTIFLVSSKSGTTVETVDLFEYFWNEIQLAGGDPADKMVAITDEYSWLEQQARQLGFSQVFTNPSDIGGRYSALSYFGLVPAALIGVDLTQLLHRTRNAQTNLKELSESNQALALARQLCGCLTDGFGVLNLQLDESMLTFGAWVEQLLAESTGKHGKGILPVLSHSGISNQNEMKSNGYLEIKAEDPHDLGGEFLKWEMATALVSSIMQINPFDQPDVESAKIRSRNFVDQNRRHSINTVVRGQNYDLQSNYPEFDSGVNVKEVVETLKASESKFLAIMAFLPRFSEVDEKLQQLQHYLFKRLNLAVTLGYGPRYLHSTGQLHKGGAEHGLFVQVVEETSIQIPIPNRNYDLARLHRAQADGDYSVLEETGRPIVRICLKGDRLGALEELLGCIEQR